MKIARVEALHADGGWRPWTFVRVETDDGLIGWGECSDSRSPYGIAGAVRDMEDLLVGQDPRPVERLYWDMLRRTRQNLGGVTHKAIAGVELALWDIKAKALGVPRTSPSRARVVPQCDQYRRIRSRSGPPNSS